MEMVGHDWSGLNKAGAPHRAPPMQGGGAPRSGAVRGVSHSQLSRDHSVESPEPSAEGLISEQDTASTLAPVPITGGLALVTRHPALVCIVTAQAAGGPIAGTCQ